MDKPSTDHFRETYINVSITSVCFDKICEPAYLLFPMSETPFDLHNSKYGKILRFVDEKSLLNVRSCLQHHYSTSIFHAKTCSRSHCSLFQSSYPSKGEIGGSFEITTEYGSETCEAKETARIYLLRSGRWGLSGDIFRIQFLRLSVVRLFKRRWKSLCYSLRDTFQCALSLVDMMPGSMDVLPPCPIVSNFERKWLKSSNLWNHNLIRGVWYFTLVCRKTLDQLPCIPN